MGSNYFIDVYEHIPKEKRNILHEKLNDLLQKMEKY
jgi:hypothetical protein